MEIGDDGIERISTQLLFDVLEVPQPSRGAGACRRLAKLMADLGWMAVRVRGLTRGGYLEQVRGYCREVGTGNRTINPDQRTRPLPDCYLNPSNSEPIPLYSSCTNTPNRSVLTGSV